MKIVVKNHIGQSVELDPFNYPVVSVDGLTPTGATINTSNVATVDGTFFNSKKYCTYDHTKRRSRTSKAFLVSVFQAKVPGYVIL